MLNYIHRLTSDEESISNAMGGMALSSDSAQVSFDMEPQNVEDKDMTINFSNMSLETPTSSLKP